jgi:hypothetical protein
MLKLKKARWLGAVLLIFAGALHGDVIYLKNGSVLVVEKAWQEGDQVKYQTASGVQTIQLSSVKKLQGQKAAPADPSRHQPVHAVVVRGEAPQTTPPPVMKPSSKSAATPDSRARARSSRYQDAPGYTQALREHEKTGKAIALYFYVDWCKYCARLEQGILSNAEVKQYLDSILYVSVNPEHGKAEGDLFAKFEGRGYPTFLILPRNQPAQEISTAVPPEAFLKECREVARGTSR